ncbi:hypothetical protein C9374_003816 [Naegleria lovaniensis]|uniref:Uncharacterized protein n=1 Tax=Naegleria lovaniensis TaxID=51637 RepID=A0AA88H8E9_NAELO|nr:uncharacterized protein C9374_003816 [Naegleria lovaniensis]KAG2394052.1 hypothetical protein C9374_003816 [Naegleria lovaniensis]
MSPQEEITTPPQTTTSNTNITDAPASTTAVESKYILSNSADMEEKKEEPLPIHHNIELQVAFSSLELSTLKPEDVSEIKTKPSNLNETGFKEKKKCKSPVNVKEAIMILSWLAAIAFCIWYIYFSAMNFHEAQNSPTTSLSLHETIPLQFPSVTVCNWNAVDPSCDYCNITLLQATTPNNILGIIETVELPHEYFELEQNGQYFKCYGFNYNQNKPLVANYTGYGGSISLFFKAPPVPDDRDARFGLQVTFHEIGTIPNVFSETNFATSGVDNFYTLTKFVTKRLKPRAENPSGIELRWDSKLSTVQLTQNDPSVVVISFSYDSLNENQITEILTSSLEGLFGEIAGIVGIFMGIDVLKVLRGVLEIPYAVHAKSLRAIWENFN